jgi:hypothetical protein
MSQNPSLCKFRKQAIQKTLEEIQDDKGDVDGNFGSCISAYFWADWVTYFRQNFQSCYQKKLVPFRIYDDFGDDQIPLAPHLKNRPNPRPISPPTTKEVLLEYPNTPTIVRCGVANSKLMIQCKNRDSVNLDRKIKCERV